MHRSRVYEIAALIYKWMAGALKWNKSISAANCRIIKREFMQTQQHRGRKQNKLGSFNLSIAPFVDFGFKAFADSFPRHSQKEITFNIPEIHHKSMIRISSRTVDRRKETMLCRFYMWIWKFPAGRTNTNRCCERPHSSEMFHQSLRQRC